MNDTDDPTDNPATNFAADLGCELGEALMPRIREAAGRTADHATFWSCFLHFLLGAMSANLGHEAAREVIAGLGGAREVIARLDGVRDGDVEEVPE